MVSNNVSLRGHIGSLCDKCSHVFENGLVNVIMDADESAIACVFRSVLDMEGYGSSNTPFSLTHPIWRKVVKDNLNLLRVVNVGFEVCATEDWFLEFENIAHKSGVYVRYLTSYKDIARKFILLTCEDACKLYVPVHDKAKSEQDWQSLAEALDLLSISSLYKEEHDR